MFNMRKINVHPHLKMRMEERGVSIEEIEITLEKGFATSDAKPGTYGKSFIFPYNKEWCGKFFSEKEVTIYYKEVEEEIIVLTVIARYGNFSQTEEKNEI